MMYIYVIYYYYYDYYICELIKYILLYNVFYKLKYFIFNVKDIHSIRYKNQHQNKQYHLLYYCILFYLESLNRFTELNILFKIQCSTFPIENSLTALP